MRWRAVCDRCGKVVDVGPSAKLPSSPADRWTYAGKDDAMHCSGCSKKDLEEQLDRKEAAGA